MTRGSVAGATIFALSSGRPPAAIAVIRVSGTEAHVAASSLSTNLPEARTAAVRILLDPDNGEHLDEALVLKFDGPESATGEDLVEFHCHGGRAVVDAVLSVLGRIEGMRLAKPGEFTRRAFENGRIDLTEAEGLADLLEAETESQRQSALRMAEGGLRCQIEAWSERVLTLSAQAEQAIDYAEEGTDDVEDAIAAAASELAVELADWLGRPRIEPLRDGVRVVAAGPPNVGKSSLINAIAGEDRIIVSAVAGTTRDVIEVPLALGGIPFVFADTAGLRDSTDAVETIGVERATAEIERTDILLWLGPPGQAPRHERTILVHSKCDVAGQVPADYLAVSAVSGEGLPALLTKIGQLGRTLIPVEGALALNRRQAAAIDEARLALVEAGTQRDPAIQAEAIRAARAAFDRCTGRAGIEDVLDRLFSRFCLGK
ncbi:MAG: tRNA uridine-5-carboxymethylaminomethyl(34) synthesis GTPase MnmE [Sphingomicrobium sp.]